MALIPEFWQIFLGFDGSPGTYPNLGTIGCGRIKAKVTAVTHMSIILIGIPLGIKGSQPPLSPQNVREGEAYGKA